MFLYGYNCEMIGFCASSSVIGMNTETLALGTPNPPFTKTLPTTTP